MTSKVHLSKRRRNWFRFIKNRKGASAVEFAIVAPIFLALTFTTFEVAWFYFVNASVDAATIDIARFVRTGQAQKGGFDKESFFEDVVCPKLSFLEDCESRITAEVQVFATYEALAADTSPVTCRDATPEAIEAIEYEPGTDNAIVRVRICMIYDTLNPAIGMSLATNDAGQRKIMSTYILRVEPYSKKNKITTPTT